jgi:hypothetical protein
MPQITISKLIKAVIPYGLLVLNRYMKRKLSENGNDKDNFVWLMSSNERSMFKKYIGDSKIYLEFGTGGSTIAALGYANAKIYSVESSKEWIAKMNSKYEIIKMSKDSGRLNLVHTDIGPVGDWGVPVKSEAGIDPEKFLNYSREIFKINPEVKSADVALIDGRFRVACFLNTLLNVGQDTVIMFHDYWDRPKYHAIMKYVNVIDGVDTLMVCNKKAVVSSEDIKIEYEKYKYNYE